jgi:hypothetical protein
MEARRRPFTPIGLVFIVALSIGFFLARIFTPTRAGIPNNQFVKVGPAARQVSGDAEPAMSRYAGHEATWKSTTGKALTIYFKKSELPEDGNHQRLPPFESMIDNAAADRWEVKMLGSDPAWRFSGPINKALALPEDPKLGLKFKYWQILEGANPPEADGRIIIKW